MRQKSTALFATQRELLVGGKGLLRAREWAAEGIFEPALQG